MLGDETALIDDTVVVQGPAPSSATDVGYCAAPEGIHLTVP